MEKTPSNKDQNKPVGDEDFAASMARLAELATQTLAPEKPNVTPNLKAEEALLKEFAKPKKKAKAKPKGLTDKWAGKTVKLNVSPYALSGVLIVILSAGIMAAPHIGKYFEHKQIALEQEQSAAQVVAAQTDEKLKSYNVFDAAKDVSGGGTELKTQSVEELVQTVNESNKAVAKKASEEAYKLALNKLALKQEDLQINLDDTEEDTLGDNAALLSSVNSSHPLFNWDLIDLNTSSYLNFDLSGNCIEASEHSLDEMDQEILNSFGFGKKQGC